MKVTFPHMGNLYIPLKSFFESLGVEVVVPPLSSKRTLELGCKYSPEFVCLPFKVTLGNFIEALEMGADTIVMAGGIGPCRFGYYAEVQREILKDLGYRFEMVVLEPPQGHVWDLIKKFKHITSNRSFKEIYVAGKLAWKKLLMADRLDKLANRLRAVEMEKGKTDSVYKRALNLITEARTEQELGAARQQIVKEISSIKKASEKNLLKVGLVGEIYTLLEPFVNFNIEKQLGELGVVVDRSISISQWVRENLLPSFMKSKEPELLAKLAEPYIPCFVGGHGRESVAQIVSYANQGVDGVIHLLPLTCMPEIVAKSVLPKVSKIHSIPVMTLVLDEHSAETGLRTRLEAFVDLIRERKEEKELGVLSWN